SAVRQPFLFSFLYCTIFCMSIFMIQYSFLQNHCSVSRHHLRLWMRCNRQHEVLSSRFDYGWGDFQTCLPPIVTRSLLSSRRLINDCMSPRQAFGDLVFWRAAHLRGVCISAPSRPPRKEVASGENGVRRFAGWKV